MCVAPVPLNMKSNVSHNFKKSIGLVSDSDIINVPCGKCIECRRTHVNGWVFRLVNEFKSKTTKEAYFLTLTYKDEEFEEQKSLNEGGNYSPSGELSLNYKHYQNFVKRLRKRTNQGKIKYFAVGEYGERTQRPHFHAIMFNADQKSICESWTHGNVHFGEVTEASITYTLKYCLKRIGRTHDKNYQEKLEETDRLIERALMSKGIGEAYLNNPKIKKYYQDDIRRTVTKEGGHKIALPRYYKTKFYTKAQQAVRAKFSLQSMESKHDLKKLNERRQIATQKYIKEKATQERRKITGD